MTQEIDFRPVIQKLRAGVCRKTSAGGSVVVDIEETEHLMRSTADLLAVVVQLQSAPPVSEREREPEVGRPDDYEGPDVGMHDTEISERGDD